MSMHTRNLLLAIGAGLVTLAATGARAELVELTNGHVMQGKVLDGRTTDDGLALELFDTSGIVIVKWDHIVESRRKALRLEHGIDLPEETVELIDGHRVLLNANKYAEGVAENPREKHGVHRYRLEDFGLELARERRRFSAYSEQFRVPDENAD